MRHALALSRRGLGRVAPNPSVGCVIVSPEGRIVGRGWTQPGGRPHAEAVALAQAGGAARGAVAYVTLEPCAHQGRAAPCAHALVAAGISRVVAAIEDPDPRTNGDGFAVLRAGGVAVDTGVRARAASEINAGFLLRVREGRPLVTLKIAQSLDGKTATASGESQWITGEESRRVGHLLRAENDAILIGIGTALADDPTLTCRMPGLEDRSPLRVVLDSRLRLSPSSKLARTAKTTPTLVFTAAESGGDALRALGVEIVRVPCDVHGRPDIAAMLQELGRRKMTRLLVEGGAVVVAAFMDAKAADRLEVFTAPVVLGGAGHGAVGSLASHTLKNAPVFARIGRRRIGSDLLESFAVKA